MAPMKISARIENGFKRHGISLSTAGNSHAIQIAPKPSGFGSSANGGEVLCLAIATCYCNDLYREAAKRSIEVVGVDVDASAEFGAEGEPARAISYRVHVRGKAPGGALRDLVTHTDTVVEIHNTLRLGMPVVLESFTVESEKG